MPNVSDLNVHSRESAYLSWCPMVRCEQILCVATDCMFWRWWTEDAGYCGFAGSPDKTKHGL